MSTFSVAYLDVLTDALVTRTVDAPSIEDAVSQVMSPLSFEEGAHVLAAEVTPDFIPFTKGDFGLAEEMYEEMGAI